ncbi:DUF4012 domain-containing protein [Paenarthrobacter nicotinovorans]|uniref:DUF4012 domain-containing protein n=1 Tax=Paenarthrobacter nicotinovorans TaxID=29320 RepID=UPI0037F350D5
MTSRISAQTDESPDSGNGSAPMATTTRPRRLKVVLRVIVAMSLFALLCGGMAFWLGVKGQSIKSDLEASTELIPELKASIAENRMEEASAIVARMRDHTSNAKKSASDPVWALASAVPWLGSNLSATTEIANSADDVISQGVAPLMALYTTLDWQKLIPGGNGSDLEALRHAAPTISTAAHAVSVSSERLDKLDSTELLPQIAEPLGKARTELRSLASTLKSAADAARIAPAMLGADSPRRYLLLVQNNAESRATGGIPGALAVLTLDKGKLSLEAQSSAGALGSFVPPIPTDPDQQAIYTPRLGRFMQDVNLTPDFATSARTAQAMWTQRKGEHVDGVLSLDPVALSYILKATGPIKITDPLVQQIGRELPSTLSGQNVVKTLLSDAYAAIPESKYQDVYFAGAAKEIFSALSSGVAQPKDLMNAISSGVGERRILLWSNSAEEQGTISQYALGGLVSGPAVSPSQFGVYFNDGTGAKMDYWVKRTVQVAKNCTRDGYREVVVRVTSTNTAPADAATALPAYVTGAGAFGVPPGSVQTNVVAYGPVQSNVDTVVKDGSKIPFAAQRHDQRSVGTTTIVLAPGESSTLDFSFTHIVQQAKPELVVTPTTQPLHDVILDDASASCN